MLNVSTQWHNASKAQFRYQAYLYVSLEVVPPGIREGTVVSSDDTFEQSKIERIVDGVVAAPIKYASLESNRWLLNGNKSLLSPGTYTQPWWSRLIVSEQNKPTLHFEFDKAYTIPGMYITWDTEDNTYPKSFRALGYDLEGTVVYDITVDKVDSVAGFFESTAMDNIKAVDLIILEWAVPNWRARVEEVVFGTYIPFDSVNNGRIVSATQTSKSDPLNNKLPTHELKVTLRNYDKYFDPTLQTGVSKYLAQQQVLKAQWHFLTDKNTLEIAPAQVYLTEKFDIPANSQEVNLYLTNRLALLDSDFKYGTYTGVERSLKSLVDYTLTQAGVLTEYTGQQPWVVPESFEQVMTQAPIPNVATNTLLQLIALAGCAWLKTRSEDGYIQFIEPALEASNFCSISQDQELGDPEITVQDQLRSLSIGVYNYSTASESTSLGSAEYTLTGVSSLVVKYNAQYASNVNVSVSGATVLDVQLYATYAMLIVDAGDVETTVTVSLTGNVVSETITYLETYRDNTVSDGMDVVVENPFVTSINHAMQVAAYVRDLYLKRSRYKVPYIGYPQLEPGDKINLSTMYGNSVVEVTHNKIEFNGGWTGTAEVV